MPDDSTLDDLLDDAWDALEDGRLDDALALAEEAISIEHAGWGPEAPKRKAAASPKGEQGRTTYCEAYVIAGAALFEMLEFPEAKDNLSIALEADEKNADANWWMGLLVEREGGDARAEKHFEVARKGDPERYPRAFVLDEKAFREEVERAIARLPEDFRKELSNLAIVVEPLPEDEILDGDPLLPPTILGLHVGTPRPERGSAVAPGPNTIFLFQKNIERAAKTHEELVEQIDVTLLHEIGHYLGLDEDEVEDRGLE